MDGMLLPEVVLVDVIEFDTFDFELVCLVNVEVKVALGLALEADLAHGEDPAL